MSLDKDRDSPTESSSSPSSTSQKQKQKPFSQSFGSFEPSQPFPPLVEDQEYEIDGDGVDGAVRSRFAGEGEVERRKGLVGFAFEATTTAPTAQSFSSESSSSEEEEEEVEDELHTQIGLHPPLFRSTGSLPGPNTFAPPFYNRPPTPLPPSPSLTSLLRPSFSATTSRPTTPDTSENETPNDTEAAVAKSARNATTVPRASPKVPTYEYYGFVLYLASSLAFRSSFFPSLLRNLYIY